MTACLHAPNSPTESNGAAPRFRFSIGGRPSAPSARSPQAGRLLLLLLLSYCMPSEARGQLQALVSPRRTNRRIAGQVLEFTRQHGTDNRIPSKLLSQRRDVYVYLPPNYSPQNCYPLVLWLHGAFGDEHAFLDTGQLEHLDHLICRGLCPPVVVVGPDITCCGKNRLLAKHSFGVNGCCGRFADHLMCEILPWTRRHYSVSCDRCQTAVVGISAGGLGAMNLALKHRDHFGMAASLAGTLNMRYYNCQGEYLADFDPATFCMRNEWAPNEVIGKLGPIKIKAKLFLEPVFGYEPGVIRRIAAENPADLIASTNLAPDELRMLVSYGAKDQLNSDAHGASFVWLCQQRGVCVDVDVDPEGNHGSDFFDAAQRRAWCWLGRQLSR